MKVTTNFSSDFSQFPVSPKAIVKETCSNWPCTSQKKGPLPLLILWTDQSQLFHSMHRSFEGAAIDLAGIYHLTKNCWPATLEVLKELLKEAGLRRLPVVLRVASSLFREFSQAKELIKEYPFTPFSVSCDGGVNENFDLVLPQDWMEDGGFTITAALLAKKTGFCQTIFSRLELLAIQKARRYLAVNAEPSIEAPAVLEPLLAELTGSGLQRLQKILPGVYQKLEQKKPDFFKKCLLETLKKSEGIFRSYPDQRASIFQEFSSLEEARRLNFQELSAEAQKKSLFLNQVWWPYDDHRLELSDEIDLIYATPVCTGKSAFIATIGPSAETISYFWKVISTERLGIVVSLSDCGTAIFQKDLESDSLSTKKLETLPLTRFSLMSKIKYVHRDNESVIHHIYFFNWQDGGVITPKDLHDCLLKAEPHKPMLVHCKAGIGRTGVFGAAFEIYQLYKEALNKNDFEPDIWSIVYQMHLQRPGMIQTCEQYELLFHYVDYLKKLG